jgi:hypothetical protein
MSRLTADHILTTQDNKPLLDLLDRYRNSLLTDSLSHKQRLLLIELNVKDTILENSMSVEIIDKDLLKYTFMGWFVYSQLSDSDDLHSI